MPNPARCVPGIPLFWIGLLLGGCSNHAPTWQSVGELIERDFPDTPTISIAQLAEQIETGPSVLLVDVRAAEEFAISRLPGAINVPDGANFVARLTEAHREWRDSASIVMYCSVGYRSARTTSRLAQEIPGRVFNLSGSIFRWANEGRPLVDGDGETNRVHPFDVAWGRLLNADHRTR